MERIVIVDGNDNFIGEEDKDKCHNGNGILHRGFLAMVLNGDGELLLARRSEKKRLWPAFWDGTVASHPATGEDYVKASERRLIQEIGLSTDNIKYLFKFQYHAKYKDVGSENEICAVTLVRGVDTGTIFPNRAEIASVRTITQRALAEDITKNPGAYTPWLILALEHINEQGLIMSDFRDREEALRA
jgi:isopentenyl-diphosphate delta-isomerase